MKLRTIDMGSYNKRVNNAAYFLLKDAIKWARLEVFGTYIDADENSVKLMPNDAKDHADTALTQLKASAKAFLHSTTVEEEVTGIYYRTLSEISDKEE